MLLARKFSNNGDHTISVKRVGRKWVLTHVADDSQFVFDEEALQFVPDIAFLVIGTDGPALLWGSELYNSRDGLAHAQHRAHLFNMRTVGAFAIDEFGVSHCFVNGVAKVESCEEQTVEVGEDERVTSRIFIAHVPSVSKFLKRMYLKKKLLGRVNGMDSLAALESQVDLLTEIVMALVKKLPADERPEIAAKLADAVKGVSCSDVRDRDSLLADIRECKTNVRSQQIDYFAERQAIEEDRA